MTDGPNIVLLMVDQWRADCFGTMDHPVVETPNIDALFARGTVFERAYAAVPSCIAARASLLTGMNQRHHGRVGYQENVAWDYPQTLAAVLADGGYLCHAVGKMHVYPARRRLGFHDVDLHDGYTHHERRQEKDYGLVDDYRVWLRARSWPDADIIDAGLGCNGYDVRPWPMDDRLHPSAWAVTRSIDFLRRRDPTRPFFLKVSFHRPHPPIDPPQWCLDRYSDGPLPPVVMGDWVEADQPYQAWSALDSPIPTNERAIDRARRGYFAQLTHIDHELNRLIHAMDEHRVLNNTVFLLLGDHGEMLYDHRRVAKSMPYEPSARVPMMLRLPGRPPSVQRSSAPVELMDVLPTLCEVAGLEVPDDVDGSSMLPLVSGQAERTRDVLHGEHFVFGMGDNQWLTDGRFKYVWFTQSGHEQLFDLENDPTECADLAPDAAEELPVWRDRLAAVLAGREEGFVRDGELVAGGAGRAVLEEAGVLTDEQITSQRSLIEMLQKR